MAAVRLGFEIGTGHSVEVPMMHLVITGRGTVNETNEFWRELKAERKAERNRQDATYRKRLAELLEHGQILRMEPITAYAFRLKAREGFLVDYWPRTGTWRTPSGRRTGRGWDSLATFLKVGSAGASR